MNRVQRQREVQIQDPSDLCSSMRKHTQRFAKDNAQAGAEARLETIPNQQIATACARP